MPFHPKDYRAIDDSIEEENVMTPGWAVIVALFFVVYFGVLYLQKQYDEKYNERRAREQLPMRPTPASQGITIRP